MACRASMSSPAQLASCSGDFVSTASASSPTLNLRKLTCKAFTISASAVQQRPGETKRSPPSAPSAPPLPSTVPWAPGQRREYDIRQEPSQGDWNTRLLFGRAAKTPGGGVKDVNKHTLWPAVQEAGDKLVVLDIYSRWCGPCRLIYPKVLKLSVVYTDVVFLKMDCISENKDLATELGIGILPTFKIMKGSSVVSEVKGAKYDELVRKIERARSLSQPV